MEADTMRFFDGKKINTQALQTKTVAVIGYGSQGRAHALNLRGSGIDVVVGVRPGGPSWRAAINDGFVPMAPGEAASSATVIAMLVPDMAQPALFQEELAANIWPGSTLLFAHGFNIHYGAITVSPHIDVVLVAPKAPGELVRRQFEMGRGVPCLIGVAQDASSRAWERALAYACGLGGARAGLLATTFAEETETDLFGEQAVLCGGVTELVTAAFDTLTEAGYQPAVAYFECMHELKLIVDLLYEGGLAKMHAFVSETAKYGDLTRGPRIIDRHVREHMADILAEIRDGRFAKEWRREYERGRRNYDALMRSDLNHPIERVGEALRARMSWLPPPKAKQTARPAAALQEVGVAP